MGFSNVSRLQRRTRLACGWELRGCPCSANVEGCGHCRSIPRVANHGQSSWRLFDAIPVWNSSDMLHGTGFYVRPEEEEETPFPVLTGELLKVSASCLKGVKYKAGLSMLAVSQRLPRQREHRPARTALPTSVSQQLACIWLARDC